MTDCCFDWMPAGRREKDLTNDINNDTIPTWLR